MRREVNPRWRAVVGVDASVDLPGLCVLLSNESLTPGPRPPAPGPRPPNNRTIDSFIEQISFLTRICHIFVELYTVII